MPGLDPGIHVLLSHSIQYVNDGAGERMTTSRPKAMVFLAGISVAAVLALVSSPAAAVEQCRFVQAKPEREACYQRQEAELAAQRKPEPRREPAVDSLQQMKLEDQELDRQIHGICRGC
jgi:hypothetical protein